MQHELDEGECFQRYGGKEKRKETIMNNYDVGWEDNIKIVAREVEQDGMDWIQLTVDMV